MQHYVILIFKIYLKICHHVIINNTNRTAFKRNVLSYFSFVTINNGISTESYGIYIIKLDFFENLILTLFCVIILLYAIKFLSYDAQCLIAT